MTDVGGDAACWLHLVCDACGAVVEGAADHCCEPDAGSTDRLVDGTTDD